MYHILFTVDSLVLLTRLPWWPFEVETRTNNDKKTPCFSANRHQKHRTKKQTQHQRTQTENQDRKKLTQASTEHETTNMYQGNNKAPEQQQENGEHG